MLRRMAVGGDEWDAFSPRVKRWYRMHPNEVKRIKKKANKRERRQAQREIQDELS